MAGRISSREFLSDEEATFCRLYVNRKKAKHAECYRRAFPQQMKQAIADGKDRKSKAVNQLALTLLGRDEIQDYIAELEQSDTEAARFTLSQAVRTMTGKDAISAAEKILKDEDKLGARDSALVFAQTMSEVGAEVVVPFPTKAHGLVCCPGCGEKFQAELPVEAVVPMSDLFPQFKGAA